MHTTYPHVHAVGRRNHWRYAVHPSPNKGQRSICSSVCLTIPEARPVRLGRHGLSTVTEHILCLGSARVACRLWLDDHDLMCIGDLPFLEPGRSAEGRIQKQV